MAIRHYVRKLGKCQRRWHPDSGSKLVRVSLMTCAVRHGIQVGSEVAVGPTAYVLRDIETPCRLQQYGDAAQFFGGAVSENLLGQVGLKRQLNVPLS